MAWAGWSRLLRALHPAWRKQRRVIRACEQAFGDDDYTLVRIRIHIGEPSLADLLPGPSGPLLAAPQYFTYDIQAESEPDFSGASREERRTVRRYLHRDTDQVRHHGRTTLHPTPSSSSPTANGPPAEATDKEAKGEESTTGQTSGEQTAGEERTGARLSSPVTLTGRLLWFGQLQLHEDDIVISGWTWSGPTTEIIPLRDVALFETWSDRDGTNFRVEIDGTCPIRGRIQAGIGLWEAKMETDERVVLKRRINY